MVQVSLNLLKVPQNADLDESFNIMKETLASAFSSRGKAGFKGGYTADYPALSAAEVINAFKAAGWDAVPLPVEDADKDYILAGPGE